MHNHTPNHRLSARRVELYVAIGASTHVTTGSPLLYTSIYTHPGRHELLFLELEAKGKAPPVCQPPLLRLPPMLHPAVSLLGSFLGRVSL